MPDESDELLLSAGLSTSPDDALASWQRWNRDSAIEYAGAAAFEILPLVYRNLTSLGRSDPELARLRGIYRYTWSTNQLLYRTGAHAIAALEEAGIESLVLKGAALGPVAYGDPGVRRMADFDLLVPRERASEAVRALIPRFTASEGFSSIEDLVAGRHAVALEDADGREVDLHWYTLWYSAPDDAVWARAERAQVGQIEVSVMSPADQLVQVCVHGSGWPTEGSIRWVADAAVLVQSSADRLDWDVVVAEARRRHLSLHLLEALSYLRHAFGVPVPESVTVELAETRRSARERLVRRASSRPSMPARVLICHWDRYRRLRTLDAAAPRKRTFPAQLRAYFGEPGYGSLARRLGRRLLRRRSRSPSVDKGLVVGH
jgi:hypothetical protein